MCRHQGGPFLPSGTTAGVLPSKNKNERARKGVSAGPLPVLRRRKLEHHHSVLTGVARMADGRPSTLALNHPGPRGDAYRERVAPVEVPKNRRKGCELDRASWAPLVPRPGLEA